MLILLTSLLTFQMSSAFVAGTKVVNGMSNRFLIIIIYASIIVSITVLGNVFQLVVLLRRNEESSHSKLYLLFVES